MQCKARDINAHLHVLPYDYQNMIWLKPRTRDSEPTLSDFSDWLSNIIQNENEGIAIQVADITYYIWFTRNLGFF